jgi:uncharacterized damage-inducible protein DinB
MHPIFAAYLERLETLHADLARALEGLPPAALDWSPAPDANSIAVLVAHIAGSERFWIGEKAGGIAADRDRASEFRTHSTDAAALRQMLDDSLSQARAVLATLTLDDLPRPAGVFADTQPIDVAWALWHELEHVAMHVGHIQMTRVWWLATAGT